jgi:MutS domain V
LFGVLVGRLSFDFSAEIFWPTATICLLATIVCAPMIAKTEYDWRLTERLADVNFRSIARIDRDWQRLPVPNVAPADDLIDASRDLDLFGQASLCHLVCHARTPWGLRRLANWIAVAAERDVLTRRQEAVRELAPRLDYRQRLEAAASFVESLGERSERFAAWITDRRAERWLTPVTWIVRFQTAAVIVVLAWLAFADSARVAAGFVITGLVLANVLLSIAFLGRVHTLFAIVVEGAGDVGRYRRLIDAAVDIVPVGPDLVALKETVSRGRRGIVLLERLTWLTQFQNMRFAVFFLSPPVLFIFLLYVVVEFGFLWDFHVAAALSVWRRRFGAVIDEALQAVGQLEAISSLASLADMHPSWTFAQIRSDGERVLEAQAIGHPLLPPEQCVPNDVSIGPPGTVLVVTGSNMSGKSTLLRAVGTNVVLAQAGGPVCARSFLMPRLQVATVMRVTDSLEAGISLFMAELLGIRRVVDVADRLDSNRDPLLLFLLDEILLGTNNAERQMAAAGILAYLMTKNAIGAVSTHDLDLVTHPSIAEACRTVYFRESFVGDGAAPRMTFDYLMRPGVAPTTNVPFLLKAVGLPCAAWIPGDGPK